MRKALVLCALACSCAHAAPPAEVHEARPAARRAAKGPVPGGSTIALGAMHSARVGHRLFLVDGAVLAAGGFGHAPVERYDPQSHAWTQLTAPRHPHAGAAVVALADGRVMLAGGQQSSWGDHGMVEVLDPSSGSWTETGSLRHPRQQAEALLLEDGRVLLVGGVATTHAATFPRETELWDPDSGSWSDAGTLALPDDHGVLAARPDGSVLWLGRSAQLWRAGAGWSALDAPPGHGMEYAASVLPDGRVILSGGWLPDEQRAVAEVTLWDPDSGAAEPLPALRRARTGHLSLVLADGTVLVVGGRAGYVAEGGLAEIERYLPAERRWLDAGVYASARVGAAGVALADGSVLLTGGQRWLEGESTPVVTSMVERWWPAGAAAPPPAVAAPLRWEPTTALRFARCDLSATVSGGQGLFIGGGSLLDAAEIVDGNRGYGAINTVERYDPASARFLVAGRLLEKRAGSAAVTLADGRVLVFGGGERPATAELWDPRRAASERLADMLHGRYEARAVTLDDGRVLVAGGFVAEAELWDPATETFTEAGAHPGLAEERGALVALPGGRALHTSVGGALVWEAGRWRTVGSPATPRAEHTATLLADGRVLIVGGGRRDGQSGIREAELFDPKTEKWGPAGALAQGSTQHAAVRLDDGRVAVVGGFALIAGKPRYLDRVEILDPQALRWQRAQPLLTARGAPGVLLLPDGTVLVAGGHTLTPDGLEGACSAAAERLTL